MDENPLTSELDLSDVVDDSEEYFHNENHMTEGFDDEVANEHCTEPINSDEQIVVEKKIQNQVPKSEVIRTTKLPMARIKNIIKMDPDVSIVSADAVFLITKATELFLETIAKETFTYTATNKRKTIAKKDLDVVINKVDCLCFLEGAMDF